MGILLIGIISLNNSFLLLYETQVRSDNLDEFQDEFKRLNFTDGIGTLALKARSFGIDFFYLRSLL